MTGRRTIVVHTKLSGHMIRVDAARSGDNGLQVMTMGQLAAVSLAGSCSRSIRRCSRTRRVSALASSSLGELDVIKDLPGMVRAAVSTLDKVWRADIDLSAAINPRLRALRTLEDEALRRLPPSMKRPETWSNSLAAAFVTLRPWLGQSKFTGTARCRRAGAHCWRL